MKTAKQIGEADSGNKASRLTHHCLALCLVTLIWPMMTAEVKAGPETASNPASTTKPATPRTANGIQLGDFEVRFPLPAGWRKLEQPSAAKVSFYSPDYRTIVTVRIVPDNYAPDLMMSEKALRMMKRYPNAKKELEAPWAGSGLQGRQIDFTRAQSGTDHTPLKFRMATAPVGKALLEVLFTSDAGQFERTVPVCERILHSIECLPIADPAPKLASNRSNDATTPPRTAPLTQPAANSHGL